MTAFFTREALLGALLIFFLRICDMSMDTLRVLFVVRGKKLPVWILGVAQSAVFILAVSNVLKGDTNPLVILGYATGFATGNVIGMWIEDQLAIGFKKVSIISRDNGNEIAAALREKGYGVTELRGMGKDGEVEMVQTNVKRKHVRDVEKIANQFDPKAFITADDFYPVNRSGFWRK